MEMIRNIKNSIIITKSNEFIIKLITSISIFTLTVFFTPNFNIISFPILILSSLTIIILEHLVNTIIDTKDLTFGKGIIGFSIATVIIYITQFFVQGYYISIISTLIAASIYGIITSISN